MAAIAVLYAESSWLRLCLLITTMSSKVITAVGSNVDFVAAIKVTPTHAGFAAPTKAKWFTKGLANGNNYAVPDYSVTVNPITGDEVDTAATSVGSLACSVTASPSLRDILIGLFESGAPVVAIREIGKDASTQKVAGYEYLIGPVTNLKENPDKGPSNYDFDIAGVVIADVGGNFSIATSGGSLATPDVDETDVNAVATGPSNKITPLKDGAARTIEAITSGDWDDLLLGKTVTILV